MGAIDSAEAEPMASQSQDPAADGDRNVTVTEGEPADEQEEQAQEQEQEGDEDAQDEGMSDGPGEHHAIPEDGDAFDAEQTTLNADTRGQQGDELDVADEAGTSAQADGVDAGGSQEGDTAEADAHADDEQF